MNDNEKIQRAEKLIAEATSLLNEAMEIYDEEKDVIAKYKNDYCRGRKYFLNNTSQIDSFDAEDSSDFESVKSLTGDPYQYYLTAELADQANKLKNFTNKLLAFKYCYDLNYKPNWNDDRENKYFIYYHRKKHIYDVACPSSNLYEGIVYFSSVDIAQKCADWLNSMEGKEE